MGPRYTRPPRTKGPHLAKFLTPEYMQLANEALASNAGFQSAITNVDLSIQFKVTDAPDGEIDYSLSIADGNAVLELGDLEGAEVSVTNDYATAVGISKGEINTQMAFMTGKLKVAGNMAALLMNQNVIAQFAGALSDIPVEY
jgi:putative sterol carrier protein